ncbi:hypothetical protein [Candidatus Poriferisodalis sp.]|uniref:hypothetical protein n=1 Tax=Candidatus Poriferisodalis sp. TaxID=3101277 RepID=UPI003B02AE00
MLAARTGYTNTLEAELLELAVVEQLMLVVLLAPVLEELVFRLPLVARPALGAIGAAGVLGILQFAPGGGPVLVVAAVCVLLIGASGAMWIQSLVVRRRWAMTSVRSKHSDQTRSRRTVVKAPRACLEDAAGDDSRRPMLWHDCVTSWWAAHPRWPICISIAAFGTVHVSNFDVTWSAAAVMAMPLVVSPQLWLGLMFTIARVRFGWSAGLVLHACHNLAVWSIIEALS